MTSNNGLGLLVAISLCGCAVTAGAPGDTHSLGHKAPPLDGGMRSGWSATISVVSDEAEGPGPHPPWPADASVQETPHGAAATSLRTGSLATAAQETRAPAPAASINSRKTGSPAVTAAAPRATGTAVTPRAGEARAGLQADDFVAEMSRVAAAMVAASKEAYRRDSGPCACPEDRDANGDRCEERSGYHGPKLLRPLCRESDVTPDMIADYMRTGSLIFAAR